MKNILAENMIRFGVKNLSKSATNKVKMLAEQETVATIPIKTASGQVYNITPKVKLSGLSDKLVLDFVNNTFKINSLTFKVDDISKDIYMFSILKQLMILWGATGEVDAKTWSKYYPIALNSIKLFATDKNIPLNIKTKFNELLSDIDATNGTVSLDAMTNKGANDKLFGIGSGTGFTVTKPEAFQIFSLVKLTT